MFTLPPIPTLKDLKAFYPALQQHETLMQANETLPAVRDMVIYAHRMEHALQEIGLEKGLTG